MRISICTKGGYVLAVLIGNEHGAAGMAHATGTANYATIVTSTGTPSMVMALDSEGLFLSHTNIRKHDIVEVRLNAVSLPMASTGCETCDGSGEIPGFTSNYSCPDCAP